MKPLTANLGLTFQARKVVLIKIEIALLRTKYQQPLDYLSKQILVMEWNVRSPVLQRKNNPGSQTKKFK